MNDGEVSARSGNQEISGVQNHLLCNAAIQSLKRWQNTVWNSNQTTSDWLKLAPPSALSYHCEAGTSLLKSTETVPLRAFIPWRFLFSALRLSQHILRFEKLTVSLSRNHALELSVSLGPSNVGAPISSRSRYHRKASPAVLNLSTLNIYTSEEGDKRRRSSSFSRSVHDVTDNKDNCPGGQACE